MSIASRIESMTEHLRNDWDIVDSLGLYAKKLPKEYTQVDYIESSGNQYIDTGVNADTNLRVILDMAFTTPTSANQNVGAIKLQSSNNARYHILCRNNKYAIYLNDSEYSTINFDTDRHYFDINPVEGYGKVDTYERTLPTNISDTELNFYLFGRNSTSTIYMSRIKQWACKMYYNNEIVRDFIPCYRNSDNEVGLYDLVNDNFYTNQGSGAFVYGETQEEHIDRNIENLSLPLNDLYNEVSDKTDLSQNGVVGRTNQESTRGINVYNVHNAYTVTTGASIGDNDYITGTFDNTDGTSDKYLNIWCSKTDMLQTSTNYLLVIEIKSVSGNGQLYPWTKHTASAIDTQHPTNILFSSLSAGQILTYNVTTKSSFNGTSNDLRTLVRFNAGQSGSITFRLSLLSDTSITSDTFVYEPFTNGPSPNPDYPQPINNLTGNVAYKITTQNGEQTFTIPLGDIELCKIDTYEDKIYSNNGRFYLNKQIDKLILDGSNNALRYYGIYGVDNAPLYYIDISTFIQPSNYNTAIIYSEHYKQWFTTSSGAQNMTNNGIRGATSSHRIYIRDDRYTSADDINSWLLNNNDNINYTLQNPTTTEITQENYPSLYNALKQIQDYLTAYKINKEFVLGYSSPEIEY